MNKLRPGEQPTLLVSPRSGSVYLAAGTSLAAFARAKDGSLAQLPGDSGCLAPAKPGCRRLRVAGQITSLAVSRGGGSMYVASLRGQLDGMITSLARDRQTGAAQQLPRASACVSTPRMAGCKPVRGLITPTDMAVSSGGRNLYVSAFNAGWVSAFARKPETGGLTQLAGRAGCFGGPRCAMAKGIGGAEDIEITDDDAFVYVAPGLAAFARRAPTIAIRPHRRCPARRAVARVAVSAAAPLKQIRWRFSHGSAKQITTARRHVRLQLLFPRSDKSVSLTIRAQDSLGRRATDDVSMHPCGT